MNPILDMYRKKLENIEEKELFPGFTGKFIHTDTMTIAFWNIKKDSVLPEHSHVHEQASMVVRGKMELTVDGKTQQYLPEEVAIIPSNVVHSGTAITDCELIDIFTPVREDYKNL